MYEDFTLLVPHSKGKYARLKSYYKFDPHWYSNGYNLVPNLFITIFSANVVYANMCGPRIENGNVNSITRK